jgi:hypothetical protein
LWSIDLSGILRIVGEGNSGETMKRCLIAVGFVIAGAPLVLAGCSFPSCTEIGCSSYFRAEFSRSGSWDSGRWEVTFRADGTTLGSCEIELPAASGNDEGDCTGDLLLRLRSDGEAIESATVRRQALSDQTPSEITVLLERDGQQVAQQTFSPTFESVQPNGPGCPPVCEQAEAEFSF